MFEDVAQQPHDMSFVLDALLEPRRDLLDAGAVAAAGFSLGGVTTLAVSFGRKLRDPRIRAAIVISGRLGLIGGDHDLGGLPFLVVHGEHDPVVPYADGVDVYRRAAPPKALVTLHVQGHQHPVEDVPATDSDDVVPAVSTAFLDIVLRNDPTAAARLRAAARPPVASLEAEAAVETRRSSAAAAARGAHPRLVAYAAASPSAAITQTDWPIATGSPAATARAVTTPVRCAVTSFSIFIASTMQITAPASTASPSATFTSSTVPCIGLTTASDRRRRHARRRAPAASVRARAGAAPAGAP